MDETEVEGCFSLWEQKVSSYHSARMTSEQAKRITPLKSPCSSFEDIQRPRDAKGSLEGGSSSSLSCLLTMVAKDQ